MVPNSYLFKLCDLWVESQYYQLPGVLINVAFFMSHVFNRVVVFFKWKRKIIYLFGLMVDAGVGVCIEEVKRLRFMCVWGLYIRKLYVCRV